jgi:excisionase family DNA binding protein
MRQYCENIKLLKIVYKTRGRSLDEASAHVGVGKTKFEEMVTQGEMPQPRVHGGRCIWDVYELDEAFERLPRRGESKSATTSTVSRNPWSDMRAA